MGSPHKTFANIEYINLFSSKSVKQILNYYFKFAQ